MKTFKSGTYINQGSYKSFLPNPINRNWQIDDMEIISLLSKADRMLGRLDMFSNHIPDIDLFISMHILKEATQSTRIEGTQTNMEEALLAKEDVPLDKRYDWAEVQNYIEAMNLAISELQALPLSSRLLRETHRVLINGVRGKYKQPGEFRRSQNWIGGGSISDAVFVPPVYTEIPDLMSDIENFIHKPNSSLPDLIKIAIIHYQFETIHPFNDGNGRVGRLLITLYLVSVGLLKKPVLYLSDYLEHHRNTYYSLIMGVRLKNNLRDWIVFFLKGIIETSENSVNTFEAILALDKEYKKKIQNLGSRSANALKLIEIMYNKPIVGANFVSQHLEISMASSYSLLSEMEANGIVKEATGSKRGKKSILEDYLNIFLN